ncbi:MAG: hypothetical protein HC906_16310 [Bacteroidales bacterium]|nr:hypothetical protein [Bacteroidales bacterium]
MGVGGDLWGNQQGALHINSSSQYDLVNIKIYDIDFYDSKNDAIFIGSGSHIIKSVFLKDINIHSTGRYGIFFSNPKGSMGYCNIQYNNIGASSNSNTKPATFSFIENCTFSAIHQNSEQTFAGLYSNNGNLYISGLRDKVVSIYDMLGKKKIQKTDFNRS